MLAATLAERLQIEDLVDSCVRQGVRGAASCAGRKVMALIYAMVLGADSIDDCQVLRAGATVSAPPHKTRSFGLGVRLQPRAPRRP